MTVYAGQDRDGKAPAFPVQQLSANPETSAMATAAKSRIICAMAHLLIVEDDELLRDALSAQLTQAGHVIDTADDGEVALERLQHARPSTAWCWIWGCPRSMAWPCCSSLRQTLPALPVLILTARDGVEDRVAGLNAGADDYLTKPFNRDELLARLQAMLRRASLPAFGAQQPRQPDRHRRLAHRPHRAAGLAGRRAPSN